MVGEIEGFLEPRTEGPDKSEPSGKASQRRRDLGGHSMAEEELGKKGGGQGCSRQREQHLQRLGGGRGDPDFIKQMRTVWCGWWK